MFSPATLISNLPYKRALEVGGHRSGEDLEALNTPLRKPANPLSKENPIPLQSDGFHAENPSLTTPMIKGGISVIGSKYSSTP